MKIAGALTLVVGIMLAAFLFLLPTSGSILGISYSCGTPIATIFASTEHKDPLDKAVVDECKKQSMERVVVGGVVGGIGIVAGAVMLGVALDRKPDFPPPNPYVTAYTASWDPTTPWNQSQKANPDSPWNQTPWNL